MSGQDEGHMNPKAHCLQREMALTVTTNFAKVQMDKYFRGNPVRLVITRNGNRISEIGDPRFAGDHVQTIDK
jgi:hypothetical protein